MPSRNYASKSNRFERQRESRESFLKVLIVRFWLAWQHFRSARSSDFLHCAHHLWLWVDGRPRNQMQQLQFQNSVLILLAFNFIPFYRSEKKQPSLVFFKPPAPVRAPRKRCRLWMWSWEPLFVPVLSRERSSPSLANCSECVISYLSTVNETIFECWHF